MTDSSKPEGAGSMYTREMADAVLEKISEGKALTVACSDEGMPSPALVRKWRTNNVDGFAERMTQARKCQADSRFDEMLDMLDDVKRPEGIDPKRARVAFDGLKWALAKLHPEVYGERIALTTDGLGSKSEEELRKRAAELLGLAEQPQ